MPAPTLTLGLIALAVGPILAAADVLADASDHWAFRKPLAPTPPDVRDAAWPRNPIDRFVLARLEAEGRAPSPEADRTSLLRRLSLDLIGLPPTQEEIDAYLADDSPEAWERQIDRLLASPHYGERWARHWLDAARYADSDGFEKDKQRRVVFYRDWVINAFNRDLPYDAFIVEQIAGDLLPGATQDQRVATGFLRNSMINEEGGVHPEQFRMEAMFDRMDAIGKGILGLTIQCAQCHDHKYDPISQEDYYRMFAFLNTSHEGSISVYTAAQEAERARLLQAIADLEAELKSATPDWRERLAAWEESVAGDQPEWTVVRDLVLDDNSAGGQKFLPQADGSWLAQSYAPTKSDTHFEAAAPPLHRLTAVRIELLPHPDLPRGGPGRSVMGTGALTEFRMAIGKTRPSNLAFAAASADVNPPERELDALFDDKSNQRRVTGPVGFAIDGKEDTAWGIDVGPGRRNVARKAVFVLKEPVATPGEGTLHFYLSQKHGGWNSDDNQSHNLGCFRISVTDANQPVADPLPAAVREALALPENARTDAQRAAVFSHWRTTVPAWSDTNARIEALWNAHPEGDSQLVLTAMAAPRDTRFLERGDFLKPAHAVAPGVPGALHPLPQDDPPTRLTFARWLASPESPTTARALVNRVWQSYFGRGFVPTSEDLGRQSEPPSHPDLLDWLAVRLMEDGWSQKSLHRLLANSATYRQSSRATPEAYADDPHNRLLARGPRFRVEGEIVRDIALAASGLLDRRVGGESIFPSLPDFLLQPPASYGPKPWAFSAAPDKHRRSLYIFRYRSLPYPVLQAFDTPPGEASCVRRDISNSPLQALVTLNESTFVECARHLAAETLAHSGAATDADRLAHAFRRCLGRLPSDAESAELLAFLAEQMAAFTDGTRDPKPLAASDAVNAPTLAAWTALSRILLNLDETLTKE